MRAVSQGSERHIPLCVDLDGTLVRTDTLHESVLELLRLSPKSLVELPRWLMKGKAYTKYRIAESVCVDVATLPYCPEVIALIEAARDQDRQVILATAAAPQIANAVAAHLSLFDVVICNDEQTNLSGNKKALRLSEHFGEGGFDYIGNAVCDIPVWQQARNRIVVSPNHKLPNKLGIKGKSVKHLVRPQTIFRSLIKSCRPHQWLKNLLIFVPLFAGQKLTDPDAIMSAIFAFAAFCSAASSIYVLNDLMDLSADRRHHRKRNRPFASGMLSIRFGVILASALLLNAFLIGLTLEPLFLAALGFYVFLTCAYSLRLKRQIVLDVMILAVLYTIRIIAGGAATLIVPSFWLLAFSMFIFLSLALVKRCSELNLLTDQSHSAAGRGYYASDMPVLMTLGASSGLISVLILALYIDTPTVAMTYSEPLWLWLVPFAMLYWVTRLWMKTQRGEVHDDPVIFAAQDKQSIFIVFVLAIVVMAAAQGWRFWS